MKLDVEGNLYVASSTPQGVWVYSPEGDLLGQIGTPEGPANVAFGGDDWKTLYWEGRLAMKPADGGDAIARWFWGETAAGQVLRRVRDRLDASADPRWKAAAFGVAR